MGLLIGLEIWRRGSGGSINCHFNSCQNFQGQDSTAQPDPGTQGQPQLDPMWDPVHK